MLEDRDLLDWSDDLESDELEEYTRYTPDWSELDGYGQASENFEYN